MARSHLKNLEWIGFDLENVTEQFEDEGIQKFVNVFDLIMNTLKHKCDETLKDTVDHRILTPGS